MVKRILKCLLRLVTFLGLYLLQIYVVNNTTFFGVTADLCLMAVAITTLMERKITAYITAGLCGIASDLLFSPNSIKYIVIYLIVAAVLIELKKMYKPDSKVAIIIFSTAAIVISEIMMYIFMAITNGMFANMYIYIFNILKECVINICLAYVIYLLFRMSKQEG